MATIKSSVSKRELIITRLINAPVKLVWEAWTNPEHIKYWWGPNGFRSTIFKMDVKPGGVWEFIMHGPDGKDYKNKSIYKEVVKYKKLSYDHLAPNFRFTVNFIDQGKKTLISIRMLFESAAQKDKIVKEFGAEEGLKQNVDKLEMYIEEGYPAEEITFTRLIKAPRELVYKAWTEPEMLSKWWGPEGFSNPVCKFDARPGGKIHIDMKAPDGTIYSMDGEVHEIIVPEKIIFTSAALDKDDSRLFEVMNTVVFTQEGDKTRLTLSVKVSKIKPGSEMHLKGMNEGWSQSLLRFINFTQDLNKVKPVI